MIDHRAPYMDKRIILEDLKLKAPPEELTRRWSGRPVVAAAAMGAVALGVVVWLRSPSPQAKPVETAYAHATSSNAQDAPLLEASGYVVARRKATVSSKITGRVTELLIEEGQEVSAGQVIARLDASNAAAAFSQAEAQVSAARANANVIDITEANSRLRLARVERLHQSGWISDQALEDARATYASARGNGELARRQIAVAQEARAVTERSLDDTVVRAPFAGIVTVKAAQIGEIVSPISAGGGFTRTGIGTIVDMSSLEVEVDVAESYINRVRANLPATVRLNAYPDWAIPGEVAAVIPTGDRSKATVKVRIRFLARDSRIVPEMGAKVAFLKARTQPPPKKDASVDIPAAAVISGAGRQSAVFVVGSDHRLELRTVRLGNKNGDLQTVLSGVRDGERVALGPHSKLHAGMKISLNDQ